VEIRHAGRWCAAEQGEGDTGRSTDDEAILLGDDHPVHTDHLPVERERAFRIGHGQRDVIQLRHKPLRRVVDPPAHHIR
jgi:hypothetical protein